MSCRVGPWRIYLRIDVLAPSYLETDSLPLAIGWRGMEELCVSPGSCPRCRVSLGALAGTIRGAWFLVLASVSRSLWDLQKHSAHSGPPFPQL